MLNLVLVALIFGLSCGQILPPIFPPGHAPGDVIDSVDNEDINEALQDIVSAIGIFDGKGVALALGNQLGSNLINPRYYLKNGEIYAQTPPVIEQGSTALFLFTREFWSLTGTAGVVAYEIENTDFYVAVMWSNPSGLFPTKAWNAKIYPKSEMPDRDMFNQMLKVSDHMLANGWYGRVEYGVGMTGSMTDNNRAKFTLLVDTSAFSAEAGPDYHARCTGNVIFGKRCERECSPLGECKTDVKCNRDSDCEGNSLLCSNECR